MPVRKTIEKQEELIKITSVDQLLRIIRRKSELSEYALFRGQEYNWPLIPKIGRIKLKQTDFFQCEKDMLNDFKRLSRPYLNRIPANDWEWLAIAQHHGMATRLLDWTTNPLAALWFAVSRPVARGYGVLWLLNVPEEYVLRANETDEKNPFEERVTVVIQPHISSNRIAAQNGWFTVHRYSEKNKKFFQFEWNTKYGRYLTKYIIPRDNFSDIRADLDRLGVNKLSLFPDIDGVAYHAEWLNSFLTDEQI